jgi:hypothetical protein
MIEERQAVTLTVVDAVQEAFDGRSAATGFIVGKVPGAVLMGAAGGGPCRVTLNTSDSQGVTLDAPPDACTRLKAGDRVAVARVTRRPADKPPPGALDVRYEWDAAR